MTSTSFTLSSSSSLVPFPLPTGAGDGDGLFRLHCAVAFTTSSSRIAFQKKKHWKEGEYPGFSEVSVSHLNNKKGRRISINKKIDRKNTSIPWVNTVPEALSDCIDKKQWRQALQTTIPGNSLNFVYSTSYYKYTIEHFFSNSYDAIGAYRQKQINLDSPLRLRWRLDQCIIASREIPVEVHCESLEIEEAIQGFSRAYSYVIEFYDTVGLRSSLEAPLVGFHWVFEILKKQPLYQPKEGTYMRLLVLLGKCGQPGEAQQVFDSMIEEGLEPTRELYTALIGAYSRSNILDKAFALLHAMIELPHCQPDVYTYSILIKACVDASRFDLVESLYEQMADCSIVPNTVTHNIVLSGYGRAGKYAEMEKVLLGMLQSADSKPDVWTMNIILSVFGNKGLIEMMERWYEKFRNFGIEPETRTFNILIGAYGKKKMYDKMSSVMEYMRKLSFPWTTSTYNNVIEVFSDAGDTKQMEYTFDQMRAEGMKADTKTFCCLIRGYANAGLFHKVINTVQLAGTLEIPEDTSLFNSVIYACAKAEDVMEMERVFKRMKDKQCRPDLMTYSTMIDAYKKEGMTDKVYYLEQEQLMVVTIHSDDSHNDDKKQELLPT